jgi:predicted nucleotide-binding protein
MLRASHAAARAKIELQCERGFPLRDRVIGSFVEFTAFKAEHGRWTAYNVKLLETLFTTDEFAKEYSQAPWSEGVHMHLGEPSLGDEIESEIKRIRLELECLESIVGRLELLKSVVPAESRLARPASSRDVTKAFVVHGHDDGARDSVACLLGTLGIEAIILSEQPSEGRTVVEKLEHYSDVGFAIVLLTPDDEGRKTGAEMRPRARQNVVFELGYFIAKLSRQRVCPLYKGDLELPSDFHGVVYIQLDDAGYWRYKLAEELGAAGYTIDKNKIK